MGFALILLAFSSKLLQKKSLIWTQPPQEHAERKIKPYSKEKADKPPKKPKTQNHTGHQNRQHFSLKHESAEKTAMSSAAKSALPVEIQLLVLRSIADELHIRVPGFHDVNENHEIEPAAARRARRRREENPAETARIIVRLAGTCSLWRSTLACTKDCSHNARWRNDRVCFHAALQDGLLAMQTLPRRLNMAELCW